MPTKRYSRQRELIYQALQQTTEHPTADMLHKSLQVWYPSLSLGTVYRNLKLLVREGLIVQMNFPIERYDADVTPHPHLVCQVCGGVIDLTLPYDPALDQAAAHLGHIITGHNLLFTGICSECLKKSQGTFYYQDPAR